MSALAESHSADVPALTEFFLRGQGVSADKLTPAALEALQRYRYPGNVRELEHTLERALILAGPDPVTPAHLSFARPEQVGALADIADLRSGRSGPSWPVWPAT